MINIQQRSFSLISFVLMFLLLIGCISYATISTVHADSRVHGVALKSPTNVYASTSRDSNVLKDYQQGTILVYESHNSSWYSATVYANGGWKTGYIHSSDVETATDSPVNLNGVALNDSTHVYSEASTQSASLKSYMQGTILVYQTFSTDWYQATVYANGDWRTGYIHKSHVENAAKDQIRLNGVGLKDPTVVYTDATTKSSNLKSYPIGSSLYYQTFSSEWYQATVYVNGKKRTGYIKKSHVEADAQADTSYKGIALNAQTHVYKEASTSSRAWKSYGAGSILVYSSFSENWYQATVYADGDWRTGYIHHSHVENAVKDQTNLRGIGLTNPTTVYAQASTGSNALKSYASGTILSYNTFTSDWYEAKVYIDGKPTTGYIHVSHTEEVYDANKTIKGLSSASPTNIYSKASKSSSVLKDYPKNQILKFETFSPNWYSARVYVNGKATTGYIYRKDVSTDNVVIDYTHYNYQFPNVVDTQMTRSPQVWKSGGFIDASKSQVSYYVNPSNFDENSSQYFQFLNLSAPAGVNAAEINSKVLTNKGTLSGMAQAFIDAGRKYNINEIYLMSHALHETGNGKSTLASGIPVNKYGNVVSPSQAVHTVYNMYGYGAIDSDPINGGAKYAFNHGWFTPQDAIIGGAEYIARNYVNDGQNTLYKMRWNPISPGHPQYATDVAWATSQTRNISEIYSYIEDYILIFDVPVYNNQPASSGNPYNYGTPDPDPEPEPDPEPTQPGDAKAFPSGVYGVTDTGNVTLNMREVPNGSKTGEIPSGSKIELLATDGTWYKVKYNGTTGWAHGDYIEILNLLEDTLSGYDLKIRPEPTTSKAHIGVVNEGDLLTVVLDANNKIITTSAEDDVWYQVYFKGEKRWVSGGENGTEYVKIIK
ncbi:SH3 domain-containing protein [Virgibacillus flavescens]|uniref:SH3 domain-containing protein n=1 Tax=Virgibacillus flavescens TaxID=1611422 RepID=UPI003D333B68